MVKKDLHGDFYTDTLSFGVTSWNEESGKFVYAAEGVKAQPTSPYDEFVYRESWGETMSTVVSPKLFLLDLEEGEIMPIPSDDKIAPTSVSKSPLGIILSLIFILG